MATPNRCLCVIGCSVNGECPLHGDRAMERLSEDRLSLATEEFYKSCVRQNDPTCTSFVTIKIALREITPLLQIPVDPRRAAVINTLISLASNKAADPEDFADKILAAIDGVK